MQFKPQHINHVILYIWHNITGLILSKIKINLWYMVLHMKTINLKVCLNSYNGEFYAYANLTCIKLTGSSLDTSQFEAIIETKTLLRN